MTIVVSGDYGKHRPPLITFGAFLADVGIAALTCILIIFLAMVLGGFNFFTPWLIVIPPIMFVAGVIRGISPGNIWIKVISLNVVSILILAYSADAGAFVLGLLVLILPTTVGIAVRRYHSAVHAGSDIESTTNQ